MRTTAGDTCPEKKRKTLEYILADMPGGCVLAYSGGMDSAYLAWAAGRYAPGRVLCVTVDDPTLPEPDRRAALKFATHHGIEHIMVPAAVPDAVRANPPDRCYHCKLNLFGILDSIRVREGLKYLLDGENASDTDDNRPGRRAARLMGVRSPLAEAGLTKGDIRALARAAGLDIIVRPQSACLSSRFPHGREIDDITLERVDMTEEMLRSAGIGMVRARVDGGGLRIELGPEENDPEVHALIRDMERRILALGWEHMKIDPRGYAPAGLRRHGR